jgi:hypothetical protein
MKVISIGKVTGAVAEIAAVTNHAGDPAGLVVESGAIEKGMRVRISGAAGVSALNGLWWVVERSGEGPYTLRIASTEYGPPREGDGAFWAGGGVVTQLPRLSANPYLRVQRLRAQVVAGETARKFIGGSSMDTMAANLPGVLKEFWPNATGGVSDSWTVTDTRGGNAIRPYELFADIRAEGEGLIVTAWQL